MRNHRTSISVGIALACLAAAGIAAAQSTPNAGDASVGQRKAVLSLTQGVGDVGMEIFDGKTQRYNVANLPSNVDDVVVHIDVDDVKWRKARMRMALDLARDAEWPVMIESATWDVPKLHRFLAEYFPGTDTRNLKNVAVRVGWRDGRPVVTDLLPSDAAVEVGIPREQTTEGLATTTAFRMKLRAPGSRFADLASMVYQANPGHWNGTSPQPRWLRYDIALNLDVVKVWQAVVRSYDNTRWISDCVVSWRGSATTGDWLRNIENQFGRAVPLPGLSEVWGRVGHGYAARVSNYQARVLALNCDTMAVTGHSLGGGTAEVFALYAHARGKNISRVETYNAARSGNALFRTRFNERFADRLTPTETTWHHRTFATYCRHGDLVSAVPIGLVHVSNATGGCTYWGARVSWLNPVANHNMGLWL
jgi:hypothetical protein